jgi:type IV secretion system protein VirB1
MGLMQVNSSHLADYRLQIAQLFEPCTNLSVGADILTRSYKRAAVRFGDGQRALMAALSQYNTGDFEAGFRNGYVAHYFFETVDKRNVVKIPARTNYGANPSIYSKEQTQ